MGMYRGQRQRSCGRTATSPTLAKSWRTGRHHRRRQVDSQPGGRRVRPLASPSTPPSGSGGFRVYRPSVPASAASCHPRDRAAGHRCSPSPCRRRRTPRDRSRAPAPRGASTRGRSRAWLGAAPHHDDGRPMRARACTSDQNRDASARVRSTTLARSRRCERHAGSMTHQRRPTRSLSAPRIAAALLTSALALVAVACAESGDAGPEWTYGPTLAPASSAETVSPQPAAPSGSQPIGSGAPVASIGPGTSSAP